MPNTATARALEKPKPLTRREALGILNYMPRLVAVSSTLLKPNSTVSVAYEVHDGLRSFVFEIQPFTILRQITKYEYYRALPKGMRHGTTRAKYAYEIFTD